MRKLILLAPLVVFLTGCPGRDGLKMSEHRQVSVDGDRVCFTVDKQDVLSRYQLATNGQDYKVLLSANPVRLSYPDTCFTTHLEAGVTYGVSYALNGKNYFYTFIIDREGNVLDLGK
ncbi:hypothetical protein RHD99_11495 [Buttiauxella selenatireducens]|uniref:Lipoprotein n=1 Tax=Buttiauxella selenatireducens TaxID=3073902 RepID=A0ABY9SG72_9ENTR|nr:putative T6SS immunity periplasmic lipoprotein [Buttiauxella sp. R73]WMY76504.1 hypothetical protein RHD99_11495 [Buttiauxella sp. R73]